MIMNKYVLNPIRRCSFEYWYMVLMIIYMAQMTHNTSRMMGPISGNPIPFVIPIFFTVILVIRNHINWNNLKRPLLGVFFLWILAVFAKYAQYTTAFMSMNIILPLYAIIVAFIHMEVYGKAFFEIYEDIVVKFAAISLVMWGLCVLLPGQTTAFFTLFPQTDGTPFGHNFLYVFKWLGESNSLLGIVRNSGLSWEPGRYAIMLCLALYVNLSKNGLSFKQNANLIILLLAIVTTFSTTGYTITLILLALYYLKFNKFSDLLKVVLVIIPIFILIFRLDFMGEKMMEKANITDLNNSFYDAESWSSVNGGTEEHISLDRFQSLFFEYENFLHNPILGYTRDVKNSWFAKTFSSDYSLSGGLMKVLSQFGLLFGLYIFVILFRSSKLISEMYSSNKRSIALFMVILLSAISYEIFLVPVFTTFWLASSWGIGLKNRCFVTKSR